MNNFDFQRKIPNQLAYIIILLFGLAVAVFVSNKGREIISEFSESATMKNIEKYNLSEEKSRTLKKESNLK